LQLAFAVEGDQQAKLAQFKIPDHGLFAISPGTVPTFMPRCIMTVSPWLHSQVPLVTCPSITQQ
jgi:hypothetical protein